MRMGVLLWVRRLAAVVILVVAAGAALAAGLLVPYFLAAWTVNVLVLIISAVSSFALLACAGTKLALFSWGADSWRLTATPISCLKALTALST